MMRRSRSKRSRCNERVPQQAQSQWKTALSSAGRARAPGRRRLATLCVPFRPPTTGLCCRFELVMRCQISPYSHVLCRDLPGSDPAPRASVPRSKAGGLSYRVLIHDRAATSAVQTEGIRTVRTGRARARELLTQKAVGAHAPLLRGQSALLSRVSSSHSLGPHLSLHSVLVGVHGWPLDPCLSRRSLRFRITLVSDMFSLRIALVGALVASQSISAFFRMPCDNPLIVERADPIISPGAISGHTHTIAGGSNFSLNSSES